MNRLFVITCLTVCLTGFLFLAGCSGSDPLAPASDQAATAEKEAEAFDITGTITNGNPLGLERRFETPSGIIHLFGYTVEAFTDGDLVSAGVFVQNSQYSLAKGQGTFHGDVLLDQAELDGKAGLMRGQFSSVMKGFILEGQISLQGAGGLAGYHVTLDLVGPINGPYAYEGRVTADAGVR